MLQKYLNKAQGLLHQCGYQFLRPLGSDLEIGDYTRRYLVDNFSNVTGVGRILVGGLRELSVRIYIPAKLAANNLTIQEVEQALRNENISLPAGSLEATNIDLTINLDKAYKDLSSIKQLPIKKLKIVLFDWKILLK